MPFDVAPCPFLSLDTIDLYFQLVLSHFWQRMCKLSNMTLVEREV